MSQQSTAETHRCDKCEKTFDSNHGLAIHEGKVHSDSESTSESSKRDELEKSLRSFDKPPLSYHPSHNEFERGTIETDPVVVSEIEQRVRNAFRVGGLENGMEFVANAIKKQKRLEREEVFAFDDIEAQIETGDPFLAENLEGLLEERRDLWRRRQDSFYLPMESAIEDKLKRAIAMLSGQIPRGKGPDPSYKTKQAETKHGEVSFEVFTVVDSPEERVELKEQFPDHKHSIKRVGLFDGVVDPRDFGIELPERLVAVESPSSGSLYLFVPAYGVTVCTCGSKIKPGYEHLLCKHELAALILDYYNDWYPNGPQADARAARLVAPEAIQSYDPTSDTL